MTFVHVKGKAKGRVTLYALSTCVWCQKTKRLLTELGVDFSYVFVDQLQGDERERILNELSHHNAMRSFPTLVINDKMTIIGFQERRIREVLGT
jgi:glutaredoxin-like protein NrdH